MEKVNLNYSLDEIQIKKIINELYSKIKNYYIFPEKAQDISDFLLDKLKSGRFNGFKDPFKFAQLISDILIEYSKDLHFYFEYNPLLLKSVNLTSLDCKILPLFSWIIFTIVFSSLFNFDRSCLVNFFCFNFS